MKTEAGHPYDAVIRGHRIDAIPPFGEQTEWIAADVDTEDGVVALTEEEWATVPAWRRWQERQEMAEAFRSRSRSWDPGCGTRHPGGVCRC